MANNGTFEGWISPLAFMEVDEPWASMNKGSLTADTVLSFLCPPGTPTDAATLVERYKQISTEQVRLFVVPNEPRILEKLVWPLRHAKASYVVGNNLAVVALCGMVSEMVAMLFWHLAEANLNGRPMNDNDEAALFGSSFEKLGQERRVRVLASYGVINSQVKQMFDTIRQKRRRYLHLWSQDHQRISEDAVACFHAAVGLAVAVMGLGMNDGATILNPKLVKYLEKQGIYEPPSAT